MLASPTRKCLFIGWQHICPHNISQYLSYVVSHAMRDLSLKLVRAARAQAHP